MTLTQIGNRTKLNVLVQCESKAQRDEAYALVEEIAISLQ